MPSTDYRIDDINPMIQYSPAGAWSAGDKATDPSAMNYSDNGTFTLCNTNGSFATFSFIGTKVSIFGAKRSNHGQYSVNLDGTLNQADGFSDKDNFTSLFDSGDLKQGPHTMTITNMITDSKKPFLDIDYITWSSDSSQGNITLEDDSSQMSYQPSNSWTGLPSDMPGFQGGNGHLTQAKNSSATLAFSGDTVTLVGAVGPNLGTYTVQVDGKSLGDFDAEKKNYTSKVPLYQGDGLGAGDHTLQVTSTGKGLAIDYALVAGLPAASASASVSATSSASASASASSAAAHAQTSSALYAGYIAAGIGGLCLLFTLGGLIYRQINRRSTRREAAGRSADVAAFMGPISLNPVASRNLNPESETAHLLDPRNTAAV